MSAGTRSRVNKVLCPDCNGKRRQELWLKFYREKEKSSRLRERADINKADFVFHFKLCERSSRDPREWLCLPGKIVPEIGFTNLRGDKE